MRGRRRLIPPAARPWLLGLVVLAAMVLLIVTMVVAVGPAVLTLTAALCGSPSCSPVPMLVTGWFLATGSLAASVLARDRWGDDWALVPAVVVFSSFWGLFGAEHDGETNPLLGPLAAGYFGSAVLFAACWGVAVAGDWLTGGNPKITPRRLVVVVVFETIAVIAAVLLMTLA